MKYTNIVVFICFPLQSAAMGLRAEAFGQCGSPVTCFILIAVITVVFM